MSTTRLPDKSGFRSGYVLLVVVGALTFIVLLVVSLAALARVESQMAWAAQQQAIARHHARLALDLALGQLQMYAGPDRRVSATAEGTGASVDRRYTGIWDTESASEVSPLVWLVSGGGAPGEPRDRGRLVELVGRGTSAEARAVEVEKQPILRPGPEAGLAGHFAYWVGDEGVRATVGQPPKTPPETWLALEAKPEEWEPRAPENAAGLSRVLVPGQLGWLRRPDGNEVGPDSVRAHFDAWTVRSMAVLADTAAGGLRQDLSQRPELLGKAFAGWSDYAGTMEPAVGGIRRSYRMSAPTEDSGWSHGIHPVLSHCLLSFNVRTEPPSLGADDGSRALAAVQVRARWSVSLWNPYSSALAPEKLRLEVDGLGESIALIDESTGTTPLVFSLEDALGSPLTIELPWAAETAGVRWLPGRVHGWVSEENKAPSSIKYASLFNTRDLGDARQGVWRRVSDAKIDGDDVCRLRCGRPQTLRLRLYADRPDGAVLLATFESPEFSAFSTDPRPLFQKEYQFSYVFRLRESIDGGWLDTPERDPRSAFLGGPAFVCVPNGPDPSLYAGYSTVSASDRLLDRVHGATGCSYNVDVPVFELPRSPLLSMGQLQHLGASGLRPFAVGNAWGGEAANGVFDRFFFSGLSGEAAAGWAPELALPAPHLTLLRRTPSGAAVTRADIFPVAGAPAGWAARHLLQAGAFNLNSVSAAAWVAVLRGTRLTAMRSFVYLDVDAASGTADDADVETLALADALLCRFPQSAAETYKADEPTPLSTYAATPRVPPLAPDTISQAQTQLFRRGVRPLNALETGRLAEAIVARVREKQAATGPFRSLADFLAGRPSWAGRNALEQAIADARLNEAVGEFSSQWITSADVMTALAPVLSARSDTFRIRAYGDCVNPATGAVTGRAWCEAWVQRLPEPVDAVDAAQPTLTEYAAPPGRLGRRFRILHYRWLNESDI